MRYDELSARHSEVCSSVVKNRRPSALARVVYDERDHKGLGDGRPLNRDDLPHVGRSRDADVSVENVLCLGVGFKVWLC